MSLQSLPDEETAAEVRPVKSSSHRSVAYQIERFALVGVLVVVVAVFSILRPATYFTTGNAASILGSQAVLLILALGLIVPLSSGDFDLSIASTLSLSSMVVAVLNTEHGFSLLASIAVALLVSVIVGLVNAACVVLIGIDSFIVTLGTSTLLLGIVQWISDSTSVTGIDSSLTTATVGQHLLGVPLNFYYGLAFTVLLWLVMEFTPVGRRLLFVGRGRSVARLSGLPVNRIRAGAFVASAVAAGVAGVTYAGSLSGADPSSGQAFLLPAFAAAYLGATTISSGRFNPFGTFIAVYFLVAGVTGLQMLGVQNYVQQLFYGGALVVAVALSEIVKRTNSAVKV
jgi:ribose transport system permease protein